EPVVLLDLHEAEPQQHPRVEEPRRTRERKVRERGSDHLRVSPLRPSVHARRRATVLLAGHHCRPCPEDRAPPQPAPGAAAAPPSDRRRGLLRAASASAGGPASPAGGPPPAPGGQ